MKYNAKLATNPGNIAEARRLLIFACGGNIQNAMADQAGYTKKMTCTKFYVSENSVYKNKTELRFKFANPSGLFRRETKTHFISTIVRNCV